MLFRSGNEEAYDPVFCQSRVVRNGLNDVVLEDENHREEDDIGNDDQYNSNSTPLESDDAADSSINLSWVHGLNALCVSGQAGTLRRGAIIRQGCQVDLDAVPKGSESDDDSQSSKEQKRNPEVSQAVRVIDMACLAKTERDTTEDEGQDDSQNGDSPTSCLGKNHEVLANENLPANLKMKRHRPEKHPHDACPAS